MGEHNQPRREQLTANEVNALRLRLETNQLTAEDRQRLGGVLDFTLWLQHEAESNRLTMKKLMGVIFGKFKKPDRKGSDSDNSGGGYSGGGGGANKASEGNAENTESSKPKTPHGKNHGRTPASAYKNAIEEKVLHSIYKVGSDCPLNCGGKLYELQPSVIVQIRGQSDAYAVNYQLQRLRCKTCGALFTAEPPEGVSRENKYDAQFKANVAVNKYMTGSAFHAMQTRYGAEELPISDATLWKCVKELNDSVEPVYQAAQQFSAQSDLFHYDDTWCKILSVSEQARHDPDVKRGCYTTVVLSQHEGQHISLYFSGNQHAGQNMTALLSKRDACRKVAMTMSDALSANFKGDFKAIVCNCLAHAVRKFKDVEGAHIDFAEEILIALGKVYTNERIVVELAFTPEQRLEYHKQHSKSVMDGLKQKLLMSKDNKEYEPNSHFGKAASYFLKHWEAMTQFMKIPGAPIDNNVCERAVKQAIRIRKTGYFHRTGNGARVASCVMSLIKICQLNKVNPLKFLVACQKYTQEVARSPHLWFPWNYHLQVAQIEQVS